MCPLVAHCHHGLGRLYATMGQREQASTALTMAIELYRAMDMTFWLPQAEAEFSGSHASHNSNHDSRGAWHKIPDTGY
jgi:hypothetical protein